MKQCGDASRLLMGLAGKAQGIKGEVSIIWHGDTSPVAGMIVFLKHEGCATPYEISGVRKHKDRFILKLKGIDDRSAAENLTGSKIYVAREDLPELKDDEAYLDDLAGYEVILPGDEVAGKLDHVEFPANRMIWSIKSGDGHEILFPAEPQFILAFDHQRQRIYIDPPPGLLDIYRA